MRIVALLVLACLGCDCSNVPHQAPPPSPSLRPGSIKGLVTFTGKFRKLPSELSIPGEFRVDHGKAQSLAVGEDGGLANVYVAIETGVIGSFPTPSVPARLDQVGFLYEPRVLGIMKDQALLLRNGDRQMHNVHIRPEKNPVINQGQASEGDETTFKFAVSELGIRIKCDVHPWMTGWIHVSDHPYFAVTGTDGRFTITSVPPGEYGVIAWHERFIANPLRAKVKIESGQATTLNFEFKGTQK